MSSHQTDNSYLADKIALRMSCIPKKKDLMVLDAFHGKGTIWKNIQKTYDGSIHIAKIDKEQKDNNGFVLIGDNIKFLSSLDLLAYDVIDLDAYGVPYEQMKIIFEKSFKGVVFVTFIQTMQGGLPHNFLNDLGYTKNMINKCTTLFSKKGMEKLKAWLSIFGISKIIYRQHGRKNYIAFTI